MAREYPSNIEAHMNELRKEFCSALSRNSKLPYNHPVTTGTADLIKDGVRQAINICVTTNDWLEPPDKEALKEFQDLVIAQVTSKLHSRMQGSVLFDAVSREALKSLHASFTELSHKLVEAAVNSGSDAYSVGAGRFIIRASPAETVVKARRRSSSPPVDCQVEQHCSPIKKNDTKTSDITFVVTITNKDAIAGMNDSDLTNLINQSIDSDPEIPNYLTNDHWISHALLLDNGDIEIHVETENDRKFLELNTYWRPKLGETLAERTKPPVCQFDADEIARLYSVLCSQPVGMEQSKVLFQDTYEPDLVKPESAPQPASTGFNVDKKRRGSSSSDGYSCSEESPKRSRLMMGEQ